MPQPTNVVPFKDDKLCQLVASDEKTHRMIFKVGSQRYALDFTHRITRLRGATGDHPARVLPMEKAKQKEKSREED